MGFQSLIAVNRSLSLRNPVLQSYEGNLELWADMEVLFIKSGLDRLNLNQTH